MLTDYPLTNVLAGLWKKFTTAGYEIAAFFNQLPSGDYFHLKQIG